MAADLWPGEGKDRKRFVELWSMYAPAKYAPNRISVPLLVDRLDQTQRRAEAEALRASRPGMFGPGGDSRVLVANDVDQTELQISALSPSPPLKDIRRCSYGFVFYEHVRSAIVHEFHFGPKAVGTPMTDRPADVSYSNVLDRHTLARHRRIHFHLSWLLTVVDDVALAIEPIVMTAKPPEPAKWWIEG